MKTRMGGVVLVAAFIAGISTGAEAPAKLETIRLEAPRMSGGMPLMEALKNRKSDRGITDKALSKSQLSEILWAANGVNRSDGKRTSPAAMNKQEVDIYAVLPEGIYLYDAVKNELVPVVAGDHRKVTGKQDFVYTAPLNLVFILDYAKFNKGKTRKDGPGPWACIAAGCMTQNVALYCASEGLGNVVRGWVDEDAFAKAAGLREDQVFLIAQTVGTLK